MKYELIVLNVRENVDFFIMPIWAVDDNTWLKVSGNHWLENKLSHTGREKNVHVSQGTIICSPPGMTDRPAMPRVALPH